MKSKSQKMHNIKPGFIRIDKNATQDLLSKLNLDKFKHYNQEEEWVIDGQNQHFDLLFQASQKIGINTLVIKRKSNHLFFNRIMHPQFHQLTFLKLCDNNLTSIQFLAFINAPLLMEINLGGNRITSLSPLIKLMSMQLNEISIDRNHITNPENFSRYLTRCPLGGKQRICEMMKLETKTVAQEMYGELQCEDLTFFAKLYFNFLLFFKVLHSSRIDQEKLRKCRKRKNYSPVNGQVVNYD